MNRFRRGNCGVVVNVFMVRPHISRTMQAGFDDRIFLHLLLGLPSLTAWG
jgi:hypothetical protein